MQCALLITMELNQSNMKIQHSIVGLNFVLGCANVVHFNYNQHKTNDNIDLRITELLDGEERRYKYKNLIG
jgi:murein tripeptide amidase MpaA